MTILACAPVAHQHRLDVATCPSWCAEHIPGDQILHVGDEATLDLTGHGEHHTLHLVVEQGGQEQPAIRMDDDPMTPDEALHLAGLLILAARRAVSR